MAKAKKKPAEKPAGTKNSAETKKPKSPKVAKVKAAAGQAKTMAVDLASNPIVAEIVAATLVAAAAAIKDPKKAREIAESAGDELGKAAKAAAPGGAFWQLAMDVARRSIDAIETEAGPGTGKATDKPKAKTKKKSPKKDKKGPASAGK